MDLSPVGLKMAQEWAKEKGVTLHTEVADLESFDMGTACWDGIVSVFGHLPPALRSQVARNVVRALKPGGVYLSEHYTPAQLQFGTGGPKSVELLATLEETKQSLAGLRFVIAQEVERDIQEGTLHSGRSAVAQVVAQAPL